MDTKLSQDMAPTAGFAAEMLAKATVTTVFLKSLSHPSRLVVLSRLAERPAKVGELAAMLNLPQAEGSRHLAGLRTDGLVTTRRDGRNVTCSLSEARTARIVQVLHAEFCT